MEIVLTVIAVIVLALGVVQSHSQNNSAKPEDLPTFENNQPSGSPSAGPTTLPTPKPTVRTLPTPTPIPNSPAPQTGNIQEFVYPGASVTSSSGQNMTLTSNDDPDKITSWYKDKIKSKALNVNSFVTTKANDKVLNKLVGDNGQYSIKVEVSRENNNVPVDITIGISTK